MTNFFLLNRLLLAAIFASSFHSLVAAGTLDEYYIKILQNIDGSPFADFKDKQEVKFGKGSINLYLVVGDVFHFIGDASSGTNGTEFPIDAMIVSANIGLDFSTNSPTIQKKLRRDLPIEVRNRIESTFLKKGPLKVYVDAVPVDTGKGFSPRSFCFVATDRPGGNTGDDKKWQTNELSEDRIASRVSNCLANASDREFKTIVTPLIGSSKVDLNRGFIKGQVKRIEMRKRMMKSITGILLGVERFLVSNRGEESPIEEFAIIVWDQDLERVIPKKSLADGTFKDRRPPGGYLELRDRLKNTFVSGTSAIRASLAARAANGN